MPTILQTYVVKLLHKSIFRKPPKASKLPGWVPVVPSALFSGVG